MVYGRTLRVDRWWRTMPDAGDPEWMSEVVRAAVCGGKDLQRGARFVLAQGESGRLVGVTCRASELSETMHSDGSRALYCFIGWLGPRRAVVPSLDELRGNYVDWAAPVYDEWMTKDWDLSAHALRQPHDPPPIPAPWSDVTSTRPAAASKLRLQSGTRERWPAGDADILWERAQSAAGDFAVAVVWRSARDATQPLTHVAAEDVERRQRVDARAPAPRAVQRPPEEREGRLRKLAGRAGRAGRGVIGAFLPGPGQDNQKPHKPAPRPEPEARVPRSTKRWVPVDEQPASEWDDDMASGDPFERIEDEDADR